MQRQKTHPAAFFFFFVLPAKKKKQLLCNRGENYRHLCFVCSFFFFFLSWNHMYYALFFFLLFLSYYYYYFLFEFSSGFLCLTGDVSVLCTSVRVSVLFNAFLTWKGNRVICCKFESKRVLGICAFACVYTESFFFCALCTSSLLAHVGYIQPQRRCVHLRNGRQGLQLEKKIPTLR